jgi:metal transporter CNNM
LVASTGLIVIFGEIIPQALCSRYALKIGSVTVPLVRIIIVIMYVVAKPISMVLDYALGEELGKLYSEVEFDSLIEQHAAIISEPRRQIMQGALQITRKCVADIMTPRASIFSMTSDEKLTFEVMSRIFKSGYSRVPVFSDNGTRVVGVLCAKDLMLVVPADEVPVITLISFFERDRVATVDATTKIEDCMKSLTAEGSHFAMVRDIEEAEGDKDPTYRYVGIITLEDIIEEILQIELVDEFDEFESNSTSQRTGRATFGQETLRLLDTSRGHNDLEPALTRAVAATLQATVPAFQTCGPHNTPMPFDTIQDLVRGSRVLDLVAPTDGDSTTGEGKVDDSKTATAAVSRDKQLYTRGDVYTVCTLVLNGEFDVVSGSDRMTSIARSFDLLAPNALTVVPGGYKADFTARLRTDTARVLRIARDEFADAVLFARPSADFPKPGVSASGDAASPTTAVDAVASSTTAQTNDASHMLIGGERRRSRSGSSSAARNEAALQSLVASSAEADAGRLQSRPGLLGISGLTSRDSHPHRRKGSNARASDAAVNAGDVAIDVADATDVD